jgi:hypothetical protein
MASRSEFQRWLSAAQSRPAATPITDVRDYAASVAAGCDVLLPSSYDDKLLVVLPDEKSTCVTQLRRDAPNTRRVLKTFMPLQ